MKSQILYVEQKTGFNDNGPAWIGRGVFSRSGRTIYFNDRAFRHSIGGGISGNYFDVETGDEYWISGVKKNRQDRHRAGAGIIMIDESVVPEYLAATGAKELSPIKYKVVHLEEGDVVSRIEKLENRKMV